MRGESNGREYVYVEQFSDEEPKRRQVLGWAIRQGQYKLVAEEGAADELYDLAVDPRELVDLLADGISQTEQGIIEKLHDLQKMAVAE